MNAKNQSLAGDDVWRIVAGADKIYVASGKNIVEFNPAIAGKEEVLPKITGRTGNLRAPAFKRGNVFYIGYNTALYDLLG
ncbi:hypothetical protein FCL47_04035 [Desulfopila sp. IMCC35006]|uniref:hypothetical protein n=1 Tax=Desulfopila sp. IMCC35006 TaxID=2569542 RepID=UPI0010ABCE9D|nr:hypothetical protein [Desulfopila sp. IMCC35006]TKB27319.1 hypothetical protein FCL47_04035 [Desulfopila sp. IMCC35006]